MPVIVKTKSKKKSTAKSLDGGVMFEATEIVDQLGELKEAIEPIQKQLDPILKKYKGLETKLLEIIDNMLPADQEYTLAGEKYDAAIGKKGVKATVTDLEKVREMLEQKEDGLFMLLATIGITELRNYLTPKEQKEVIEELRVNKRRVKIEAI